MHLSLAAIDYEQGKAAAAQDALGMARDRIAHARSNTYEREADCHWFTVTTLLCEGGYKIDVSGSDARRAYYGRT